MNASILLLVPSHLHILLSAQADKRNLPNLQN